ncbi:unnamed protein product [Schistosoma margrebowiei]|uniref:Uncharacterized protein n=1 Tax=Schistosoma margrebowiei TaxID=48269 RepID=A0A183MHF7_9TREM|nr:unnamed protein product [Schistosoma margrebowiei]
MVVGGSQQETLEQSYLRLTAIDQSLVRISASCEHYRDIGLIHNFYRQKWIIASSGIQDARFVLFETLHLDEPSSQNRCSLSVPVSKVYLMSSRKCYSVSL